MKAIPRTQNPSKTHDGRAALHPSFQDMLDRLVQRGVKEQVGTRVLKLLQEKNPQFFLKNPQKALRNFSDWLESFIQVGGAIEIVPPTPRYVALVGPTGVGKTTTLAKLAGHLCAVERKKIALVTVDTYRLAAEEQLRAYARVMKIPLGVAHDAKELAGLFHNYREMDMILMDTAGRSPYSVTHLKELRGLMKGWPIDIYLLISATTRFEDMSAIFNRFSLVKPSRLIVTKVDETKEWGALLNISMQLQLPISYLTNGQEVPDDIEVATSRTVARLIVGDGEDR